MNESHNPSAGPEVETARTPKHEEARKSLPEDLLEPFDALVADYKFYASVHYGARLVSYRILADLVRAGWRPHQQSEP